MALRWGSGGSFGVLAGGSGAGEHREGTLCPLHLFDRSLALFLLFGDLPPVLFLQLTNQHWALGAVQEDLTTVRACTVWRIELAENEPAAITKGHIGGQGVFSG